VSGQSEHALQSVPDVQYQYEFPQYPQADTHEVHAAPPLWWPSGEHTAGQLEEEVVSVDDVFVSLSLVPVIVVVVTVSVSSSMVGASTDCTVMVATKPCSCSLSLAADASDVELTAPRESLTVDAASGSSEEDTIVISLRTVTDPASFLPDSSRRPSASAVMVTET
jgi:hypothetical protein